MLNKKLILISALALVFFWVGGSSTTNAQTTSCATTCVDTYNTRVHQCDMMYPSSSDTNSKQACYSTAWKAREACVQQACATNTTGTSQGVDIEAEDAEVWRQYFLNLFRSIGIFDGIVT